MKNTCHAFRHAFCHKLGLRIVYLHLRQTHAALPKLYGSARAKTCLHLTIHMRFYQWMTKSVEVKGFNVIIHNAAIQIPKGMW